MTQEPELEEGEACLFKDDTNIDPDIDLSYIGDKVQSILGHLQKDFEGGVSAENLGAKFGGYGTFLPTHQRSPSIWLQPKSPQRVQDLHLPRSPNHVYPEGPASNSTMALDAPSTRGNDYPPSSSIHTSQTLRSSCEDASIRQKATSSAVKISGACPGNVELPSTNSGNPPNQRTLKVRIKVGPDKVAQYNAEIYSLGLTSPSSSEGNSPDGSDELLFQSHEIPNESPTNILQIMTALPVSGGVSPLSVDLLNLVRETEYSGQSLYEAAPKSSAPSVRILNNDVFGKNKKKLIEKSETFEKSEDKFMVDLNDGKQKTLVSDNLEYGGQSSRDYYGKALSDTVRESEKDAQVKNRRPSKHKVKGSAISGDLGSDLEWGAQPFSDFYGKALPDTVGESEKNAQVKNRRPSKHKVKGSPISGDLVKDSFLEHPSDQSCGKSEQPDSRLSSIEKVRKHQARISQMDASVDHGQGSRTQGSRNCASVKDYSDKFEDEDEWAKGKVGLNATSSEHNGFGTPHAMNGSFFEGENKSKGSQSSGKLALKADSLRNVGCASPDNKYSGKKDIQSSHLRQKDVAHTCLEFMDKKRLLERPSGDKPKNFTIGTAKAKSSYADKLKERSRIKNNFDKVASHTLIADPSVAASHAKEDFCSGLDQMVAAPIVIQEDWVGCDRCQKWRLLPYGTKSEQLPDKWVCSMLDWLPGMNCCDISEDETTKAVHASYLVPVPGNQHTFQTQIDGATSGVISANANDLGQNHQNCDYDQMKKQKLNEKRRMVSMSGSVPSNGKKQLHQLAVKNGSLKEVKHSSGGVNATYKSDLQNPNKSAVVAAKSNKRKGEQVIGDDANPRLKIQKKSTLDVGGKVKKIKSKDVCAVENFQTSGGNLGTTGHSLTSGLPNKVAKMDGMKKNAQKNATLDQKQKLADDGHFGLKTCNGREVSTKRIKLKDCSDNQHRAESWQNNRGNLRDRKVSINNDHYIQGDKKLRVSQIEEEFKRSQGGDTSTRKSAEPRVRSLESTEYPVNWNIEKEEQVSKPRAKVRLTVEDIDKLRKDLGCEQPSTAATSSSSKVSDSRKNRIRYMELKGSPEESVSSSPIRMSYQNQVSPMMEMIGKVDSRFNVFPTVGSMKGSSEWATVGKGTSRLNIENASEISHSRNKLKVADVSNDYCAPKHEVSSNKRHRFPDKSSIKSVKNGAGVSKRDLGKKLSDSKGEKQATQRQHGKNDKKSSNPCSTNFMQQDLNEDIGRSSAEKISTNMEPWNGKLRIDLRQGDKQGALCPSKHASGSLGSLKSFVDSKPLDTSLVGDTSKTLKDTAIARLQNETDDCINSEAVRSLAPGASLRNNDVSGVTAVTALKEAEDVLKEAEDLRMHADLIKNSGFSSESNYEYFKSALKFLHGASLLEGCNAESSRHLEMNPMLVYGAAAKLCNTCACEYEKGHEMAAAALAYKCVEVAYLRVVYCKSSTTHRVWRDLQSSLQMVPQGESPSSSASDIDNLNNLAVADKATLSKGSGSLAGNHVILPRNRPNFVRLLDFTKDVNSAMEAAQKSQDTFSAARVELEESQKKEAIVSIKRVIDFSFQNVAELVHLVWLALNTINHQGLRGSRE